MPSYLVPSEYRASPTAASTLSLVSGGDQATQDAALVELIAEASALMDDEFTQSVISASFVQWVRTRIQPDGTLSLHLNRNPPNQLVSVSVGTTAANLTAIADLTGVFLEDRNWVVPYAPLAVAGGRVLAKVTAVAAWPNTTITSTPNNIGATSLTVASAVGFTPFVGSEVSGDPVTIYDGKLTEIVTVTNVAGNVLTLAAPGLVNAHSAGTPVSMLPPDIKRACVFGVNWLLKSRQSDAVAMNTTQAPGSSTGDRGGLDLYNMKQICSNYARVR